MVIAPPTSHFCLTCLSDVDPPRDPPGEFQSRAGLHRLAAGGTKHAQCVGDLRYRALAMGEKRDQ